MPESADIVEVVIGEGDAVNGVVEAVVEDGDIADHVADDVPAIAVLEVEALPGAARPDLIAVSTQSVSEHRKTRFTYPSPQSHALSPVLSYVNFPGGPGSIPGRFRRWL